MPQEVVDTAEDDSDNALTGEGVLDPGMAETVDDKLMPDSSPAPSEATLMRRMLISAITEAVNDALHRIGVTEGIDRPGGISAEEMDEATSYFIAKATTEYSALITGGVLDMEALSENVYDMVETEWKMREDVEDAA